MSEIKTVCTLNELKKLDVINLCDGRKLGCVNDVQIDLCTGCVIAILVPKKLELIELFRREVKRKIRIPWCQIERIGDDTILVHYREEL